MSDQLPVPAGPQWYDEVPRSIRRHAAFGLALLVMVFGGFGAWAFMAPLAAAVIAQGSFVATGQNKILQHLEGGIIEEILVSEGDFVRPGDVLLSLDNTAARANERELFVRQMRLEATAARLVAQYQGWDEMQFPKIVEYTRKTDAEVASIIKSQQQAFLGTRSARDKDISLLQRNIDALTIRNRGYEIQLGGHKRQLALLTEEFEDKRGLQEKGLVRKSEINVLHRAMIETEAQIGRLEAEIAETEQIRLRYEAQIDQVATEYKQKALESLQEVQAELESVREKARKAKSVLERSDVTAPIAGTVVRMHYHTPGGVIETGKPILEILPTDAPLIVETLIARTDIDTVHLGQGAVVRLSALNQRTTPVLNGEVIYISADAVNDTTQGEAREVYVARISLSPEELERVRGFTPTPGMPAEIMIQTAERTFAQYIAKPIVDSMSRAFREQ